MGNLNTLINRMKYWCLNANLGYNQYKRWNIYPGGECDCSSLVIFALREAGFDTGSATYTGNLSDNLTKRGWKRMPVDGHPQPGDVLLNDVHHVAVYIGNGQLAQASISENGTISGRPGDQTNNETNVRAYYNYPWNCYLRYQGGSTPAPSAPASNKIDVDGICGPATVRRWQEIMGTPVDGVISGQVRPDGRTYDRPALTSVTYADRRRGIGTGSALIKAVQRKLNASGINVGAVDGLLGPGTIRGLHQYLGVAVDAYRPWTWFGNGLVRVIQRRLNEGRF